MHTQYSYRFGVQINTFIPRSPTCATFFTPIPVISHFDLLALRPEKSENLSKFLKISKMESVSFIKDVVSSAYKVRCYLKPSISKALIFLFAFIIGKNISMIIMNM